jgi:hypothetical protein
VGNPSKGLAEAAAEKNAIVLTLKIKEKFYFSIDLCVFNKISCPPSTMVAKTASIVNGRSQ